MAGKNYSQMFVVRAKETIEETRKVLIATAKAKHSEVMRADPKPSRFIRVVDGVANAREEAVKADGRVVYRYPRVAEVVQAAMDLLFDLSPVSSGDYRNGHTIFMGGGAAGNLSNWDGVGEIVITNMVPYAREIELGKMKMRILGTDHVYQQAEFILRQRFGNQARIKFIYRGVVGGAMPDPASFGISLKRRGAKGRFVGGGGHAYNKAVNRFPALEIEAK